MTFNSGVIDMNFDIEGQMLRTYSYSYQNVVSRKSITLIKPFAKTPIYVFDKHMRWISTNDNVYDNVILK